MRHRNVRLGEGTEIREYFDADAVRRPAIGMRSRPLCLLALLARSKRLLGSRQRGLIRRGRKIPLLRIEDDPSAFRDIEHDALRERIRQVECGRPFVLALGGGAFAQERNYELLRQNGVSIWLDCPLEMVQQRVANATHRPLARDAERFNALYHARRESYARADYRIEITCDDPLVTVDSILTLPIF